jgi:hypothetical protein
VSGKSTDNWYTLAEAVGVLGVSDRTIRRRIEKGELETKLEGNSRYVYIDTIDTLSSAAPDSVSGTALMGQIKSENEHLREQVTELQLQLKEERLRADDARERQDTLMLQLTRQLEQSQRLLEYSGSPWYRRWFRKRRKPPEGRQSD